MFTLQYCVVPTKFFLPNLCNQVLRFCAFLESTTYTFLGPQTVGGCFNVDWTDREVCPHMASHNNLQFSKIFIREDREVRRSFFSYY